MNRILVCYDGSPESRRAVERVGELAHRGPANVTVISLVELAHRGPGDHGRRLCVRADLVVIGAGHRRGRLPLRTVTGDVVAEAPSDVLVVR